MEVSPGRSSPGCCGPRSTCSSAPASSAADAVAAGLATRVSPDPLTEAVELAHRIAALPPQSVRETKRLLNAGYAPRVAALIDDAMGAEWQSFDTPEFQANLAKLTRPKG